jgi:hypothetical protein
MISVTAASSAKASSTLVPTLPLAPVTTTLTVFGYPPLGRGTAGG